MLSLLGCSKSYLDKKPSTTIESPNSLSTFEKILDNFSNIRVSSLLYTSSDEYYYLDYASYQNARLMDRNAYIWKKDIFEGTNQIEDWNIFYTTIFNCNIVLENIKDIPITSSNKSKWNMIKGWALFYRAWSFFQLVQTYSPVYNSTTSEVDMGVPLKLTANADEVLQRSSLKECYAQIINDLSTAVELFELTTPETNTNRPSKPSAFALLARVYLSMSDYESAERFADSCLSKYSSLEDLNTLILPSANPFANHTKEILFYAISNVSSATVTIRQNVCVDSTLYATYSDNDLRKLAYFQINSAGRPYSGRIFNPFALQMFGGLTTSEAYLIKSECLIRRNEIQMGIRFLNDLLRTRWKTNTYVDIPSGNFQAALNVILLERRKELIFRGTRWTDIRRLNKEGANIIPARNLNGQSISLSVNSPLYVLPIPDDEIALSGIKQNVR